MIESGTADYNYVIKSPKNAQNNDKKENEQDSNDPLAFFEQLGNTPQITKPKVNANPFADENAKDSNPLDFFDNLIQPKQNQIPAVELTQNLANREEEKK